MLEWTHVILLFFFRYHKKQTWLSFRQFLEEIARHHFYLHFPWSTAPLRPSAVGVGGDGAVCQSIRGELHGCGERAKSLRRARNADRQLGLKRDTNIFLKQKLEIFTEKCGVHVVARLGAGICVLGFPTAGILFFFLTSRSFFACLTCSNEIL